MATNTNNNVNQEIQDYVNKIQAQYDQAEQYIKEMEKYAEEIADDDLRIKWDKKQWWNLGAHGDEKKLEQQTKELRSLLADDEEALEKFDPGFTDLINAINGLLDSVKGLTGQHISSGQLASDVQQIQQYISQIFQAMEDKLQADKYLALIQGANGDISDAQLEQYAEELIGFAFAEQSVLTDLIDTMSNDALNYHQQYDNAKTDKAKYNVFEKFFNWNGAVFKISRDKQTMNNANAMTDLITNTINNLIPELASLSPEFIEIQIVLDQVLKQVEKIINDPNLSPKEKQGEVLALMMFLLGFFSLIQQDAQSGKTKNQKMMSQANLDASTMNIEDSKMNSTIAVEEMRNAKILQKVMFVAQIIIGVLLMLLAPGFASALVMLALLILSTAWSGPNGQSLMDKLTKAIAEKTGQTWAEVIVTAMEVVATAGGGAALDAIASQVAQQAAQTAVKAAMQTVQSAIKDAVEQAVSAAGKTGDEAATLAAKDTLEKTAEQAAQKAAQTTFKQFTSQSLASQAQMFGQGTYKTLLDQAMNKAATQAGENAVDNANSLAVMAANGAKVSQEEMTAVANEAATKAIANTMNQSSGAAAKASDNSVSSAVKTAAFRGTMAALYGTASNNLLLDGVMEGLKKLGVKEDDKAYEIIKIITQVMQDLIQMIALMWGSGMLSQIAYEGSPQALTRIASLFQTAPQGIRSIAQLGMYQVDEAEGDAVKGLQLADSISELLKENLDLMTKSAQIEFNRFLEQQRQELQSDLILGKSLHKGDTAGIQVLAEQAV